MRFGVSLPVFTADPDRPLGVAARAATLGFDGVFSPDHLFPPVFYPPSGPDRPALEAFTLLSAVAARHPGLHVGTLVARVTLRAPGILAKQAAALDLMSGGNAILGLGAGDSASRSEHETYGIPLPPPSERLALLEETVCALRALFSNEAWAGGTHVPAMNGPLLPTGGPELWVGGLSEALIAIAGRVADRWNGWGQEVEGFARSVDTLGRAAGSRTVTPTWGGIVLVGEDDTELERLLRDRAERGLSAEGIWTGTADELTAFVSELAAAGAEWFIVLPVGPADRLELIATTLLGR